MRIALIQGHPDPAGGHLCNGLADAYVGGATEAGHEVRIVEVATLPFQLLRTKAEFDHGKVPPALAEAQQAIGWAEHLVFVYPLWLGGMPALLKGFLEQVARPGFAFEMKPGQRPRKGLRGKSARVIITMGMPTVVYRWYFGAHGLKSLQKSILSFVGIKPMRATLIGLVETMSAQSRQKWLARVRELGAAAR
jgi:putative NADPH-quinone reductase